jgi:hypothetical protein
MKSNQQNSYLICIPVIDADRFLGFQTSRPLAGAIDLLQAVLERYFEADSEPRGGNRDGPVRESFCRRSTPRNAIQTELGRQRTCREHVENTQKTLLFTIFTIFIVRTLDAQVRIKIWWGWRLTSLIVSERRCQDSNVIHHVTPTCT